MQLARERRRHGRLGQERLEPAADQQLGRQAARNAASGRHGGRERRGRQRAQERQAAA